MSRQLPSVCLSLVLLSTACGREQHEPASTPPNIVLIIADDLGWNDVGYHGGPLQTPNIDALAREGVTLERFYCAPVCTPTRAGLFTGRYPIRFGMMRSVVTPWRRQGIPPEERTLPEALADAGYERRALFGKWHLGHLERRWHPLQQGFTHFHGHYNGAIDYFTHQRAGQPDWHVDYEPVSESGYSTDLIADAAASFVRDRASQAPFLCVVSFNAPHEPIQARPELLAQYPELAGKKREIGAMVQSLDDGIGRILASIEAAGIRENTLVWFLSDNGGIEYFADNNLPLRGDKGDVFEGGIRVPSCLRWPSAVEGGRVLQTPLAYIDVMPTLLGAARLDPAAGPALDGLDLGGLLRSGAALPQRDLFSYVALNGPASAQAAISSGPWKLVRLGPELRSEPAAGRAWLFDLSADPNERTDVGSAHPQLVEQLAARLASFLALEREDELPGMTVGQPGFLPPGAWRIPAR